MLVGIILPADRPSAERMTEQSDPETSFLEQLGQRVRTMRALRGMSRKVLAKVSGISERYIAQLESGKGNVSIVLLLRLAQAIRCEQFAPGEGDQWDSLFSPPKSATSHR
jgi:XRE family aerobic/anaerobic benzoate catabolism transcriptional regulator